MHTGNVQHLYIEMNAFLSLVVLTTDTLIGHMFKYLMTNTLSVFINLCILCLGTLVK